MRRFALRLEERRPDLRYTQGEPDYQPVDLVPSLRSATTAAFVIATR
jgi:hypothetical protein